MNYPGDPDFRYFDEEEKELIDGIEENAESLQSLPNDEQQSIVDSFRRAATKGRRSITVRLDEGDLEGLKTAADREGMPYQTLLGSVIHKYVTGNLVDLNEARKLAK